MSTHCAWEVYAGMIPGQPMKEYTKTWAVQGDDPDLELHKIEERGKAMKYADELQQSGINWVRLDFVRF